MLLDSVIIGHFKFTSLIDNYKSKFARLQQKERPNEINSC